MTTAVVRELFSFSGTNRDLTMIQKGALLLKFARDEHEVESVTSLSSKDRLCYHLRAKYQLIVRIAMWLLLILNIFSRPLWTFSKSHQEWPDSSLYPSYCLSYADEKVNQVFQLICVIIIGLVISLEFGYAKGEKLQILLYAKVAILLLKFVDVIGFFAAGDHRRFDLTFPLPFLAILIERKLTNKIVFFSRVLPKFVGSIFIFTVSVMLFTGVAFTLFNPDSEEYKQWFPNYATGLWNMFVVVNGSNWPGPIIPAYENNRFYFVFFFIYVIIINWFVIYTIIGLIYSFFKNEEDFVINRTAIIIQKNMTLAFDILRSGAVEKTDFINADRMLQLIEEYNTNFEFMVPSDAEKEDLFIALFNVEKESANSSAAAYVDSNKKGIEIADDDEGIDVEKVYFSQFKLFHKCCNGHALRVLRSKTRPILRSVVSGENLILTGLKSSRSNTNSNSSNNNDNSHGRSDYEYGSEQEKFSENVSTRFSRNSRASRHSISQHLLNEEAGNNQKSACFRVTKAIDSYFFDLGVDITFMILAIILFAKEVAMKQAVSWLIILLLLFEVILKMLSKGFYRYRTSFKNCIDFLITTVLTMFFFVSLSYQSKFKNHLQEVQGFKTFIILRMLLFARNLWSIEAMQNTRRKYRDAFMYAFSSAGNFFFLLALIFATMYFFTSVGMYLFGGVIIKNNSEIVASYFGQSGYWPLNFNDFPSGFGTLFTLLQVNNMHVTTSGFVAGSSDWAELFFFVWYSIGVLLLLNVLSAYIISKFISYLKEQLKKQQGQLQISNGIASAKHSSSSSLLSLGKSSSEWKSLEAVGFNDNVFADERLRNSLQMHINQHSLSRNFLSSISHLSSINQISSPIARNTSEANIQLNRRRMFSDNLYADNNLRESLLEQQNMNNTNTSVHTKDDKYNNSNNNNCDTDREVGKYWNKFLDAFSTFLMATFLPKISNDDVSDVEFAAACIHCARLGLSCDIRSKFALICLKFRSNYEVVFKIAGLTLVLMRIFERPLWTYGSEYSDWHSNSVYPQWHVPFMSNGLAVGLKIPLLFVVLAGLMLEMINMNERFVNIGSTKFNHYVKRVIGLSLVLCAFVQICLLFYAAGRLSYPDIGRYIYNASDFSLVYLIWFSHRSYYRLKIVCGVLPMLLWFLVFFSFFILFFAIFGPMMFQFDKVQENQHDDGVREYFSTYSDSVWSVFVAITSSSYPNQIMPSYRVDRVTFIFVFLFISLGAFLILNLILATVIVEYQKSSQSHDDILKANKYFYLSLAFNKLVPPIEQGASTVAVAGGGGVNSDTVQLLIDELLDNYNEFKAYFSISSKAKRIIVSRILDLDGDGVVTFDDFQNVIEVTKLRFEKESKSYLEALSPSIRQQPTYRDVIEVLKSKRIPIFFDFSILLLIIGIYSVKKENENHRNILEFVVFLLFIVEFVMATHVRGFLYYFRRGRGKLDGLLTIILIIVYGFILGTDATLETRLYDNYSSIARIIMTIRLFLLPRNIPLLFPNSYISESYYSFLKKIKTILQTIGTLSIVFLGAIYVFSTIGMYLFGGKITAKSFLESTYHNELANSKYGQNNFYTLNFNDFPSAFVTLFCCLHVSDFDVITDGFVAVTSGFAKIYFAAWYVIGVLLCLNILKSIFFYGFIDHYAEKENGDDQKRTIKEDTLKKELDGGGGGLSFESTPALPSPTPTLRDHDGALKQNGQEQEQEQEHEHEQGKELFSKPMKINQYWVSINKILNKDVVYKIYHRMDSLRKAIDVERDTQSSTGTGMVGESDL